MEEGEGKGGEAEEQEQEQEQEESEMGKETEKGEPFLIIEALCTKFKQEGCSLDMQDNLGRTALHYAAENNWDYRVAYLSLPYARVLDPSPCTNR